MTKPPRTCITEGCENQQRARQMCSKHWSQWAATRKACSVEDCERGARARGLCSMHYYRLRDSGEVGEAEPRRRGPRPCKVDVCENLAVTADDLCPTHRRRKRLYGDEHGAFSLTKVCSLEGCEEFVRHGRREVLACEDHYLAAVRKELYEGKIGRTTSRDGYVYVSVWKRSRMVHRLVMEHMIGRDLRDGESVHHKNGVRDDNRPENLELWVSPTKAGQPYGQRVDDLVAWVCETYPDYVAAFVAGHPHLFTGD